MQRLIWTTTALLLALWTLCMWAAAALTSWAGGAMLSGVDWPGVAATVSLPGWLTWWVDPAWLSAAIEWLLWGLESAQDALPWLGSAVGWLVVALWVTWGLGTLMLLALAGGTHWLVARAGRPAAPAAV
jgi:hypothetical protein